MPYFQPFPLLRSLLLGLCVAIITLLLASFTLLTLPFTRYETRYRLCRAWSYSYIYLAWGICGLRYEIQGLENLPKIPCIAAVKHQSLWEAAFMQTLLPPQTWVMKAQLLRIPFFGWALAQLKPIAIDRSKHKSALQQILDQGQARLREGLWIVIFPEGTRVREGKSERYSRSASTLSVESGAALVPITHNAGKYCRPNLIHYPGTIQVVIGPPLQPSQDLRDALHIRMVTWLEDTTKSFS